MAIKDIRNYWYPGSPLGGLNQFSQKNGGPSATNIERYLAPLVTPRPRQDPRTWKEALIEAEIPLPLLSYRYKMQQMFNDTILDAQVFACIERRKDMTLLKDYAIFDDKGNIDEEATILVKQSWFKEIMNYALDAKFYGYTLLSIGEIENGTPKKISLLRRQNVSPDRLNIAFVPYSPGGIQFMDSQDVDDDGRSFSDWTLWFPTPSDFGISSCGYGLLYKVALYQTLIRNNLANNSTYNEIFGQPLRVARSGKKDLNARNELRNSLEQMGSSAYMVLDEEDKVEFINATTGSGKGNDTYDNLEQRLEKKISKIILGHADAMDSTAGKLGSSGKDDDGTGKAIEDKEKKDVEDLEVYCNDIILPKLAKLGVKIPLGKKLRFKNDKEKQETIRSKNENSLALANIAKILKEAGFDIPEQFIVESTGIPVKKAIDQLTTNTQISKKVMSRIEQMYK